MKRLLMIRMSDDKKALATRLASMLRMTRLSMLGQITPVVYLRVG
jgi:hypothetical protein